YPIGVVIAVLGNGEQRKQAQAEGDEFCHLGKTSNKPKLFFVHSVEFKLFIMSIPTIVFTVIALLIFLSAFFTVKQQTAAIIERFGRFQSIRHSGLQLKIPIIDKIAGKINLKIQQLDVVIETKTKDNVFVKIKVSVQFMVIKDKVYDAFY